MKHVGNALQAGRGRISVCTGNWTPEEHNSVLGCGITDISQLPQPSTGSSALQSHDHRFASSLCCEVYFRPDLAKNICALPGLRFPTKQVHTINCSIQTLLLYVQYVKVSCLVWWYRNDFFGFWLSPSSECWELTLASADWGEVEGNGPKAVRVIHGKQNPLYVQEKDGKWV